MPQPPPGFELDPLNNLPEGFVEDEPPSSPPEPEKKGILDLLWEGYKGGAETAAQLATGAIAQPISGIAGLAKTITSGPEEGAKTIEQIQNALTYQPRSMGGQVVGQSLGKTVEAASNLPGIKQTGQAWEKSKEEINKIAGPAVAAGVSTLPTLVMELIGLRGTKAVKRSILKKGLEDLDKTKLYDEVGNLSSSVKDQIKQSGLELSDIEDILPENIVTQKAAEPIAKQIKGVESKLGIGEKGRMENLAEEVKPDMERIKAFEELNVDYLPSHVSQNPTYAAIEQNLQTIPGSMLAPKQKSIIADLGKRADDIIIEGGGELDKSIVSDRFRNRAKEIVGNLGDESSKIYKAVNEQMPSNTLVDTKNIIDEVKSVADDLGGVEYLNAKERQLLKVLNPKTKPTYARLDKFRKQIGEALRGKDSPFKDSDRRTLGRLYEALGNDQETALLRHGDKDLLQTYLTGKYLTAHRKGIEEQLINVLGKDLTGEISQKIRPAVLDLQKGYTQRFDKIIENIPEDLGLEAKTAVLHTALNDAFVQGSRAQRSLNIAGFDDWMKGLKRHPQVYQKLKNQIGSKTMTRLETLHKAAGSVRESQNLAVLTGRTISTPGLFDESSNIAKRFYGESKRIIGKFPGLGGIFGDVLEAGKNARSLAADQLLSSAKFRNMLKNFASGKIDNSVKKANAEKLIEKIKEYKKWKKTLPPAELKDLNTIGAVGYLMGGKQENKP